MPYPCRTHRSRFQDFLLLCACLLTLALVLPGCQKAEEPPPAEPVVVDNEPPEGAPKLVLLIVVDQLRADYLERFAPLLNGGLAELARTSISFTDAHQDHAHTVTATGHAALGTGQHPNRHGVIGNGWYDRETKSNIAAVTDPDHDVSPRNLEAATLGDYLKTAYPSSKSFGVGAKDRSAIMTSGGKANAAFFFNTRSGDFKTSTYYLEEAPPWLEKFNAQRHLDSHYGKLWTPLVPLEVARQYGIEPVDFGYFERGFPHAIGGVSGYPDRSFYSSIYGTPFIDEAVVELAKTLIAEEQLGQDAYPDFLSVNLSAVDAVGHGYGPDSPELLDTIMRADRAIADLLRYVESTIGGDQVIVALSADHGVGTMPEVARKRGTPARRLGPNEIRCFQQVGSQLDEQFGAARWLENGRYLDRDLVAEKAVSLPEIQQALAAAVGKCPGVLAAYTSTELLTEEPLDEMGEVFRRSHHPTRSPDVEILVEEGALFTSAVASHGTPYRYDTHVPNPASNSRRRRSSYRPAGADHRPGADPGRLSRTRDGRQGRRQRFASALRNRTGFRSLQLRKTSLVGEAPARNPE